MAGRGDYTDGENENSLDSVCTDSTFVALRAIKTANKRRANEGEGSENNNLLSPELTLDDYIRLDTDGCGRDVYSKFYLKLWDFTHNWIYNNELCEGSPRVMPHWSDDDEKHVS